MLSTIPAQEHKIYGRIYREELFDVEQKLYSGEPLTEDDRTKILRVFEMIWPARKRNV